MDKKIVISFETTGSHEVDPQKGFTPLCPNELPVPDGHLIADELNRQALCGKFRTVSKDAHPQNAIWLATETSPQFTPLTIEGEPNVNMVWNAHCMVGTEGCDLIPGLPPLTTYDLVIYKGVEPNLHPYSGCYHDLEKRVTTGLIESYFSADIDTIIVGGLALDFCLLETVRDMVDSECFNTIIVNLGATKAVGDPQPTIDILNDMGVILINSVDDLHVIHEIDEPEII